MKQQRKKSVFVSVFLVLFFCFVGRSIDPIPMSEDNKIKNSLSAHWSFDEGEGQIAFDKTENHNDAALLCRGEDCLLPKWTEGIVGSALEFDGEDDYVWIPVSPSLRPKDRGFTVTAWVRPNQAYRLRSEAYKGDSGTIISADWDFWKLGFNGWDGWRFRWSIPGMNKRWTAYEKVNAEAHIWYHLVGVRDRTQLRLYVNGEPASHQASISEARDDTAEYPINIGANMNRRSFFSGVIDEVRVYNRTLTEQEIKQLYENGHILQTSPDSLTTSEEGRE